MLDLTVCWAFADDLYIVELQELPGHLLDDKDGYLYVASDFEAIIGHELVTFIVIVTAEPDWSQVKASAADITVTVQQVTALSPQELAAAVVAGATVATRTTVVAPEHSSEEGTTTDDDDASIYVYSDDKDEGADLELASGDTSTESTEAAASSATSASKHVLHLDAYADAEEAPAKKLKCE
jgi:hypothetical protein